MNVNQILISGSKTSYSEKSQYEKKINVLFGHLWNQLAPPLPCP